MELIALILSVIALALAAYAVEMGQKTAKALSEAEDRRVALWDELNERLPANRRDLLDELMHGS